MEELERTQRLQLWLDSLPIDQQAIANYTLSLEGGTQANAHTAILLEMLSKRVAELEKRGPVKDLIKVVGLIGTAVGAALGGIYATLHGGFVK